MKAEGVTIGSAEEGAHDHVVAVYQVGYLRGDDARDLAGAVPDAPS